MTNLSFLALFCVVSPPATASTSIRLWAPRTLSLWWLLLLVSSLPFDQLSCSYKPFNGFEMCVIIVVIFCSSSGESTAQHQGIDISLLPSSIGFCFTFPHIPNPIQHSHKSFLSSLSNHHSNHLCWPLSTHLWHSTGEIEVLHGENNAPWCASFVCMETVAWKLGINQLLGVEVENHQIQWEFLGYRIHSWVSWIIQTSQHHPQHSLSWHSSPFHTFLTSNHIHSYWSISIWQRHIHECLSRLAYPPRIIQVQARST